MKRFDFKELSKLDVVETAKKEEQAIDEIIREAIINKLHEVVSGNTPETTENNDEEHEKKIHKLIYDPQKLEQTKDAAFNDGYQKGYAEAEKALQPLLEQNNIEYDFAKRLSEILERFEPESNIKSEYIEFVGNVIEEIVNKLALDTPINFKKIIETQINELINSAYERGEVIIKVNPKRKGYLEGLISSEILAGDIEKIRILSDQNIADNDSIIEYKNTKLIYNFENVKAEIENIVKEFKIS